ncbi:MAG: hypothetical protein ACK5KN_06805 [Dysgonomonas sp.]|uniref:hypothetical protein n=1 Tax=Dysgonomonas sp. TaxID=1891233 RepID=UPI003A8B6C2E
MKVVLTALSDEAFKVSRLQLEQSVNITNKNILIHSHDFSEIEPTSFYKENYHIFKHKKGLGYWLWKPYIIYQELSNLDDNDILIYSDSEIKVIESLAPVIKLTEEQPIVVFGNGNLLNSAWTKRDCFVLMDCDTPDYWYSLHCDAAFVIFRKCNLSLEFVKSWLDYAKNENILTDLPNSCGKENLQGFIAHRWDQSILSLLAQKYKLNIYRVPTQFGNFYKTHEYRISNEFKCINQAEQDQLDYYAAIPFYNSPYHQLLNHHRTVKKRIVSTAKETPILSENNSLKNWLKKLFR